MKCPASRGAAGHERMRRPARQRRPNHHACFRPRVNLLDTGNPRHKFEVSLDSLIHKVKLVGLAPDVSASAVHSERITRRCSTAGNLRTADVYIHPGCWNRLRRRVRRRRRQQAETDHHRPNPPALVRHHRAPRSLRYTFVVREREPAAPGHTYHRICRRAFVTHEGQDGGQCVLAPYLWGQTAAGLRSGLVTLHPKAGSFCASCVFRVKE